MGDTAMAERRNRRIEKSVEAVRKHMWDEKSGTFLAVKRDTLEKVPVATIGSWMPLMADVPTEAMVKRMAEAIHDRELADAAAGAHRGPQGQALGPEQLLARRCLARAQLPGGDGFARHGYREIAAEIADKTVANALKNGISEHYDSVTGKPLGVPYIGMSCTIVTMMLDGLCSQYQLRVRR